VTQYLEGTDIVIDRKDADRMLTEKQRLFADYLREDFPQYDIGSCYMRAFPKCKKKTSAWVQANKIMKKSIFQEYMQYKFREAEKKSDLTQEQVLRDLEQLKEMCMGRQEVPVMATNKDGEIYTDEVKVFNATGAIGALELQGKHLRMFSEKVEIDKLEVNFNFDMSGDKKGQKVIEHDENA
jgi:hypothetical protein